MDEAKDKRTDGRKPLCFIKSRKWVMTDGRGRSDGPGEPGERALRSSDAPWRAGRAGARAPPGQPAESVAPPAGGRAASGGMTRTSARRPACPRQPLRLSSFPPSYPTSFLASPHSSSSLLSPSAAAAAFASVAGMQFPSYFGIYFGPLPRGPIFRSLAPSLPTSFFAPSDRESSGLPARPPACRGRAVAAISRDVYATAAAPQKSKLH